MRVAGLEPARMISPRDFKSLVSAYSTTPAYNKWGLQGSNLWPSACKADALPAELRPQLYSLSNWKRNDPERDRTVDLRRDRAAL